MNNYADRELCQEIYDRKLILDAEMWLVKGLDGWFDNRKNEAIVLNFRGTKPHKDFAICPAYNCVELLDALPEEIIDDGNCYLQHISKLGNIVWFNYNDTKIKKYIRILHAESDISLCNCLAKMLIYLDDKELLKEKV